MGGLQKSVGIGRKLVPYILVPHHGEDIVLPPEPVHLLHQVHILAGGRGGGGASMVPIQYSTYIYSTESKASPQPPFVFKYGDIFANTRASVGRTGN